jgi:hypothetical protein
MWTGFGGFFAETIGLADTLIAQELLLVNDVVSFNLEVDVADSRKIKAWRNCKKVVVASAPGEEEYTLTIQLENNWAALQFAQGELAENVNITLPVLKQAIIPATPFEIVDPAITAGNADKIKAYLQGNVGTNQAGYLTRIASGTPTARQFVATATGTKLTFAAALSGGAVAYTIPTDYTSLPSVGKAPSPIKLNKLSFYGLACSSTDPGGILIRIPLIQATGKPSFNTEDDEPVLELTFDCLTAPGERSPVSFFQLPAAA